MEKTFPELINLLASKSAAKAQRILCQSLNKTLPGCVIITPEGKVITWVINDKGHPQLSKPAAFLEGVIISQDKRVIRAGAGTVYKRQYGKNNNNAEGGNDNQSRKRTSSQTSNKDDKRKNHIAEFD